MEISGTKKLLREEMGLRENDYADSGKTFANVLHQKTIVSLLIKMEH